MTQRLMLYWKECKERGQQSEEIELPPWDTAVRVVEEERKRDRGLQTKECIEKRYEEDCEKEKRRWNLRIAYQMFARLRTALLYIVIFCGVDYFMGFVEDQVMGLFGMQAGRSQDLPYGIRAVREYEGVVIGCVCCGRWFALPLCSE